MASKKSKSVITLSADDYKGKNFKTAPGGVYVARISPKSTIKQGPNGDYAALMLTITEGKHKGVNVFDNISPTVGWKIAQLLKALGIKKTKLTLEEFMKLIKGKEIRISITEKKWKDKMQNKVSQYLPVEGEYDEDEDDADEDSDDEDEDDADEDDEDSDEDDDEDSDDEDEDDDEEEEESDEDEEESDEDDDDEEEEDDDAEDEDEDDSDDDDDEEEEEEDEEEEKPAKKAKKAAPKKAAKKAPAKKAPAKKK